MYQSVVISSREYYCNTQPKKENTYKKHWPQCVKGKNTRERVVLRRRAQRSAHTYPHTHARLLARQHTILSLHSTVHKHAK